MDYIDDTDCLYTSFYYYIEETGAYAGQDMGIYGFKVDNGPEPATLTILTAEPP